MQKSYLPNIDPKSLCDVLKLCSVRGDKIAIKRLNGEVYEDDLVKIANEEFFEGYPIVRVYSSGHVFFDEKRENVYLVTTQKDGIIQHQFTGGSPLEDINKDVIYITSGKIKFNLAKIEDNAMLRTLNRTGVKVTENFNEIPFVDWILMERIEDGNKFFRLICLLHFAVKKYEGELGFITGSEGITYGNWYNIEKLPETENVAPNAYVVTKKALEIIQ